VPAVLEPIASTSQIRDGSVPAVLDESTTARTIETNESRGRKRKRDMNSWKKNVRKRLKNLGQDYVSVKGKQIKAKLLKVAGHSCR